MTFAIDLIVAFYSNVLILLSRVDYIIVAYPNYTRKHFKIFFNLNFRNKNILFHSLK